VGPYLIRFALGVDREATLVRIQKELADDGPFVVPTYRTGQVASLGGISQVPNLLAGLTAALAAASLIHTLVVSVRRRRRDLAILKTLGFVSGQVRRAVAWQAAALSAIALLVGLPIGAAAGRWTWRLFADRVGAVPSVAFPWLAFALVVPATLAVANLAAFLPGRSAAHTRPAIVLRSE
jgi:putative ABC transport system permease protein